MLFIQHSNKQNVGKKKPGKMCVIISPVYNDQKEVQLMHSVNSESNDYLREKTTVY